MSPVNVPAGTTLIAVVTRPRHPDKDLEAILCSLERQDWRVIKKGKYYKCYCPPPHAQCIKTVKLTPSDPNYAKNLRGWLKRAGREPGKETGCWEEKP